jgi:DNA-binding transcriptional regulator YiaG
VPAVPLGAHIGRRRSELALTLREAAQAIGVSLATVKNWEKGRTAVSEAHRPQVIRFLGYEPNPAPRSLSERLRAARCAAGLSSKALALRLGLNPSTVRAWEAGRVRHVHGRVRQVLEEFMAARRAPLAEP